MPKFDEMHLKQIGPHKISEIEFDSWNEEELNKAQKLLENNNSIKIIKINNMLITSSMMKIIIEILFQCKNLKSISFKSTEFTSENLKLFCQYLEANMKSSQLTLWECHLYQCDLTTFYNYLYLNRFLYNLDLWGNNLSNQQIDLLCQALSNHSSIVSLHIGQNNISQAESLKRLLVTNNSLLILDCWSNQIDHSGLAILCEGLQQNTTLTQLELRNNPVGQQNTGILALCKIITDHSTLVRLNLGNCQISQNQAENLNQAFSKNEGLVELNLTENNLPRTILNSIRINLFSRANQLEKIEKCASFILFKARILFLSKPNANNTILTALPREIHIVMLSYLYNKNILPFKALENIYYYAKSKENIGKPKAYFLNSVNCNRHLFFKSPISQLASTLPIGDSLKLKAENQQGSLDKNQLFTSNSL